MDDEKRELPAPPRFRNKIYKILTLTLLFLALFFSIGFIGLEASSSSNFCSSCHEMKPEYYTWKASSHGEVDCVNCHIEPGVENLAKAKGNGLMQLIKKQTQNYTAPIRMQKEIPDSACEKCHNMNSRNVTPSGDLIIPHDKHMDKDIECIQCHNGVAHAKIADRKMTYEVDYKRWDEKTGQTVMKDLKFVKPDMETCMDCHIARKVTIECSSCHTSTMVPDSHKKAAFAKGEHAKQAATQLAECNECHKYMSKEVLEGYEELSVLSKYLEQGETKPKKNHLNYAKENTYCQDCHNKRPASHTKDFFKGHGVLANQNDDSCAACHDLKRSVTPGTNQVNCSSCHPSSHNRKNWREKHPVPLTENQKPSATCYKCHVKKTCTNCHKEE